MRTAIVTLIKALLISAAALAVADYFNLPVFSEAGGTFNHFEIQ
jgi:hypothetical protein